MNTFLLEIGTEELPADFARLALPQLEELVLQDLAQKRLSHGPITCSSTPRRILLLIENLASAAEDLEELRKGPPAKQAFSNGSPTSAATGFAKSLGVSVDELEVRDTEKGPFVFAKLLTIGAPSGELLQARIPIWIASLQGRRFMRWGDGDRRFSRPIRWLVAMLDEELIPVSLEGSDPIISSAKQTKGHRLYEDDISIESATTFFDQLKSSGVVADRKERGSIIKNLIKKSAEKLSCEPDLPIELFEELIDLVEAPLLVQGAIPDRYLDLPPEVLSTVMKVHQRYIPLYKSHASKDPLELKARNIMLSQFLCISNALPSSSETVKLGNERVLKARLADAEFFVNADRSVKSNSRRLKLDDVTFAEGLGSLLDRVKRMEWLVNTFPEFANIADLDLDDLRRSTYFCKHDLVSQIVGEFPELQGLMGGKYLLEEGENRNVALAVIEHYLPRGANDTLPLSINGSILSIIERVELLLSIFSKGERPSGSSDPYALRRAGNGILQILWSKDWNLDLYSLLEKATNQWASIFSDSEFTIDKNLLLDDLTDFFRQRIITLLEESSIDIDLVQSVAGATTSIKRLLSDPLDAKIRAELLSEMRSTGQLLSVQAVVTRASRLAEKGDLSRTILSPSLVVNSDLFEKDSEQAMLKVLEFLEPIARESSERQYKQLAEGLASGADALGMFFDGENSVMVMSEDLAIRKNRLNLLSVLRNQSSVLADFSQING